MTAKPLQAESADASRPAFPVRGAILPFLTVALIVLAGLSDRFRRSRT